MATTERTKLMAQQPAHSRSAGIPHSHSGSLQAQKYEHISLDNDYLDTESVQKPRLNRSFVIFLICDLIGISLEYVVWAVVSGVTVMSQEIFSYDVYAVCIDLVGLSLLRTVFCTLSNWEFYRAHRWFRFIAGVRLLCAASIGATIALCTLKLQSDTLWTRGQEVMLVHSLLLCAVEAFLAPCLNEICRRQPAVHDLLDAFHHLQTGDALLLRQRGLLGFLLAVATCSRWSHAAFVVRGSRAPGTPLQERHIHVSESVVPSVRFVRLLHLLQSGMYSEVLVRRLATPLGEKQKREVVLFAKHMEARKYEDNVCNFIRAGVRIFDHCCIPCCRCTRNSPRSEEEHKLFCSEYVTLLYQHLKLLTPELQANEITPADFGPYSGLREINELFLPASMQLMCADSPPY